MKTRRSKRGFLKQPRPSRYCGRVSLKIGVFGTSRKENEFRLPIHPAHIPNIDPDVRGSIYLEEGYGRRFGPCADLEAHVAGVLSQEHLLDSCDVLLLPKPVAEDLDAMKEGQVLWGWPHCVQDEPLTQRAIDRKLTIIAWEAMNHWGADGSFNLHVFHKNNELAGYASVMHSLQLIGRTGQYGAPLRAAVISFGATGRGAVTALNALGIFDVMVMTQREPAAVGAPMHTATMTQFGPAKGSGQLVVASDSGEAPMIEVLADHHIIVNCVLQDPEDPYMFITNEQLKHLAPGSLVIDVSCDEGMGFEWAKPTTFEVPIFDVGDNVHYYGVDHSPSYLWDSATWEISEALLPYLRAVMGGPDAWASEPTIGRAVQIRDGVVVDPKILSFQKRMTDYPHERR